MTTELTSTLEDALEDLSSAEDFLEFFDIPYQADVVQVNRLHIMQRFHDYLGQADGSLASQCANEDAVAALYRALLTRAYQDFVDSDALTEKVFKVFRMHEPQTAFVPIANLFES